MMGAIMTGKTSAPTRSMDAAVSPSVVPEEWAALAGTSAVRRPHHVAPGTHIAYHPELIEQLRRDHLSLLGLLASMEEYSLAGDMPAALSQLHTLKRELQAHVLLEKVRLYVYLDHQLPATDPSRALVRQMRHRISAVANTVSAFVDHYRASAHESALTFMGELESIAQLLVSHIQEEEDLLYPLYRPAQEATTVSRQSPSAG